MPNDAIRSEAGSSLIRNQILRELPEADMALLRPHLHPVSLVMRQVLHEVGAPIHDVYFPESGLVSLTAGSGDTEEVEVGVTGRDGFVGLASVLAPGAVVVHRAFVQVPGTAYRIQVAAFTEALAQSAVLRDLCMRYVQFMLVQTAQCAACNARHGLPERLARWLLAAHARLDADELPITQEFLSFMLGVRRAGVSVVANALQEEGLIRQFRGRMVLVDVAGLQAKACGCFSLIETNRARIMNKSRENVN